MRKLPVCMLAVLCVLSLTLQLAQAWDYEGHRLVNQLALASLPTNFPSFVREPATVERVAFLAGEPDRWRNTPDLPLRNYSYPDHYIDLEQLADYGMTADTLPSLRYDFIAQLALFRKDHPEKFVELRNAKNDDHTRELVGLLPWAITENYGKLKSGFSYLKAFQEANGTPQEIANAEANIIYIMGTMGHYVGDASQPLHTTIHHHGWVGENPHHYGTNSGVHAFIDGYFKRNPAEIMHDLQPKLRPAQIVSLNGHNGAPDEMFRAAVVFIVAQNKLVEPLYAMDKEHKLSHDGDEGKKFLEGQILKSSQLLGDIWFSAWQQAPPDKYLKDQLSHRAK
jgi:hypothetical protein